MRRPAVVLGAALAVSAVAATATSCGGGNASVPVEGVGVNPEIRLADCTDWQRGSTAQRLTTLRQLENFSELQADTPAQRGPVLGKDKGYDVLDSYCKEDFARSFKLYKLYERAAAFGGH